MQAKLRLSRPYVPKSAIVASTGQSVRRRNIAALHTAGSTPLPRTMTTAMLRPSLPAESGAEPMYNT